MKRISLLSICLVGVLQAGVSLGADTPPFRKQGAEPLITVFLTSGSTILVDKTWVKGDRLFYFSRGVRGSVPLMDVNRLEDLRDKLRTDSGR